MCIHPRTGPNGERLTCRKCWQCISNYQDLWVGKCIAESKTAVKTYVVNLTYGSDEYMGTEGNDMRAVTLCYPDVQLWLKRLRHQSTGRLRFLAAGEYGDEKGRAHWHVLLFCESQTVIPNLRLDWRYIHEGEKGQMIWPHGISFWQEVKDPAQVSYVCKYIQKDEGTETVYNTHVSKQPALGTDYFTLCAKLHVDQGLSPQDTYYGFPDVLKTHGKQEGQPRRYVMTRSAAYKYCQDFVTLWRDRYGENSWPQSDLIDDYFDALAKLEQRSKAYAEVALIELKARFKAEAKERNVFTWLTTTDVNGKEERTGATPLYLPFPVLSGAYLQQSRGS